MTDQELLELAAKAAGIDVKPHSNRKIGSNLLFIYKGSNWNPLTDDGDALRLAVHCGMRIESSDTHVGVSALMEKFEPLDPDPYAATRRAIVRAAAEIGRRMEVTK
jgi:hypothetical protein